MSSVQVLTAAALVAMARGGNFIFHTATTMDWSQASDFCGTKYGTTLASIHTLAENERVKALTAASNNEHTWIGVNDVTYTRAFLNADGSATDYQNWADDGELCAVMSKITGEWTDIACSTNVNVNFVCNAPAWVTGDTFASPNGEWLLVNFAGAKIWYDARQYCDVSRHFSSLASIRSQSMQDEMYAAMQIEGFNFVWFGYSDLSQEGNWLWADGYTGDTDFWQPGQPNHAGGQNCAAFAEEHDGRWIDTVCSHVLVFFCNLA